MNDDGIHDGVPFIDRPGCRLTAMRKRVAVTASPFSFPDNFALSFQEGLRFAFSLNMSKRTRIPAPNRARTHRTMSGLPAPATPQVSLWVPGSGQDPFPVRVFSSFQRGTQKKKKKQEQCNTT